MLMSVLESFVVDPLVEWTRVKQTQGGTDTERKAMPPVQDATRGKRAGQIKLDAISERLDGVVKDRVKDDESKTQNWHNMPFSTQGLVHHLIQEATNDLNLARAYSGWSSFL